MHPVRKQRLMMVLALVIGVSAAAGLIFYALKDNLNLFYTPSQIVKGEAPVEQRIRAGGMVVEGSVKREANSLKVTFDVTDYQSIITVQYEGILPSLFAEKDGVVVTGFLNEQGLFSAKEVLAKHDENYMPPEVASTLKEKPEGY